MIIELIGVHPSDGDLGVVLVRHQYLPDWGSGDLVAHPLAEAIGVAPPEESEV